MTYLRLFWEFLLTGLFAFGGGMATLPFIYKMSDATGWFSYGEIADIVAISECTPGPIGVNMATYAGFKTGNILFELPGGILGGIVATMGLIIPSIIVILIVSSLLDKYSENRFVKAAFYGLRPASCAMIACAGLRVAGVVLLKNAGTYDIPALFSSKTFGEIVSYFLGEFRFTALILGIVLFIAMKKIKVHPVFFLLVAAIAGIIFKM